jgi:arginine deiminase
VGRAPQEEHDAFAQALRDHGAEVLDLSTRRRFPGSSPALGLYEAQNAITKMEQNGEVEIDYASIATRIQDLESIHRAFAVGQSA